MAGIKYEVKLKTVLSCDKNLVFFEVVKQNL